MRQINLTNKVILSSLYSLFLLNTLSAKDILKEYTCGQSFNGEKNERYSCKTIQVKQAIDKKIIKIKDFKTLFTAIGTDSFLELYQSKKNQKLLDDIFINDYTHTFLIYKKVVNFKEVLEENLEEFNTTKEDFIKEISLGGEFIALIHIQTHSKDKYEKIRKKISNKLLTFSNIKALRKKLLEIEKNYDIKIKNYISDNLPLQPTDDINTLFNNFENFEMLIKGENTPIALKYYHDKKESLRSILNAYYLKNNLNYIKKHPQEFKISDSINKYAKKYYNVNQALVHYAKSRDKNCTIKIPSLPARYNASLIINPIKTLPFTYSIKEENVKVDYPRIDKNIKFSFSLQIHDEIKRDAKVIIETTNLTIKSNNKIIATEKNAHIKVDTFVNYPKLLFSKINSSSLGSIEESFIFNKYEQEKKIKGFGPIKEATCGYKVSIKTNKLQFYCKEIKLKPLDITFKHK